ncbi:MAG: endonuclease domain-containing protein [Candidatus Marinimicrobia bacterium]|nr:endonuclease domain-containing protein [Candidatus Neomarinimicrobiota bacterium]MBL7060101.1 endonuclease domain-containing protein [Candidatus Neomarinimicrobiota bacterium]
MKIYYNPKLKQLARNLRNNSTLAEVLLWVRLKGKQMMGYRFMRQKPIGEYIVDFFCSKLSLVIEVDGESHYKKERQDLKRQEYLESIGLTVLRFDNDQIKEGLDYVLQEIEDWIKKKETQPTRLKQG